MKTRFVGIVLTALLASASLYAQSAEQLEFQAPFAFQVGKDVLPAGTYTVARAGVYVVSLRSVVTGDSVLVGTTPVSTSKENARPMLTFNRYGDKYFLSHIWHAGQFGQSVAKSRAEKEMEISVARAEGRTVMASYRK